MRALLTGLVLVATLTVSCSVRQAQRIVQTSLDSAMLGVVAGDEALATALPASEAGEHARERAEVRCAGSCPNLAELVLEEMHPWVAVVTGLQHARLVLYTAQDGLTLWIDTGTLPDFGPLCDDVEGVYGDLVSLLSAVGVPVPEQITQVGPYVSTACGAIARFVQSRTEPAATVGTAREGE